MQFLKLIVCTLLFASWMSCKSTQKKYTPVIPEVETASKIDPADAEEVSPRESPRMNSDDEGRRAGEIDRVIKKLGLSAYQAESYKAITHKYRDEMRVLRSQTTEANQEEMKVDHAEMLSRKDAELESIFSEEQMVAYKAHVEQSRGNRGNWAKEGEASKKRGEDRAYERQKNMERKQQEREARRKEMRENMNPKSTDMPQDSLEKNGQFDALNEKFIENPRPRSQRGQAVGGISRGNIQAQEQQIAMMVEALNLDESTAVSFGEVSKKYSQKFAEARISARNGKKADMKNNLTKIASEQNEELKTILSQEEYAKYIELTTPASQKEKKE